jgi:methylated-DNA-[protein]-cysteine S-methyltransferase
MRENNVLYVETPLGPVELREKNGRLTGLNFREKTAGAKETKSPVLAACAAQLTEYFDGKRKIFDLPLDLEGTAFQRDVWKVLGTIPFGRTTSYGEIARKIDRPSAVRAVGAANGANPVSIISPCHRVVGSDGSLTGYGGGFWRKKWLLEHERKGSGPLFT